VLIHPNRPVREEAREKKGERHPDQGRLDHIKGETSTRFWEEIWTGRGGERGFTLERKRKAVFAAFNPRVSPIRRILV